MALPHYNPNSSEDSLTVQQDAFPVILVPADAPQKTAWLRNTLRSKLLLTGFGILAVLACAALLWFILDPNKILNLKDKEFVIPASVLAGCLLFFLISALAGRRKDEQAAPLPNEPKTNIKQLEGIPNLPPHTHDDTSNWPPHTQIEVCFEQWSSEPFNEIIDEAVLAEVFNDEMVAPDHMVISLQLDE